LPRGSIMTLVVFGAGVALADQVRDAHERQESNANFGKIVLTFT
jgi:hypothetical protein